MTGPWFWLVVMPAALLVFRLLLTRRGARWAHRVAAWAAVRMRPVMEPEELALWRAARLRRLYADLRRLERRLATDEWMSATRQIANRIAHRRLLQDVSEAESDLGGDLVRWAEILRGEPVRSAGEPAMELQPAHWAAPVSGPSASAAQIAPSGPVGARPRPAPEVLELGPARRVGSDLR